MVDGILEAFRQQRGMVGTPPLFVYGRHHLGRHDILLALRQVVLCREVETILHTVLEHILSLALLRSVESKVHRFFGHQVERLHIVAMRVIDGLV